MIVVTAGREQNATWPAAQDKLATLSTNSRHDLVADATHASLVLDETDAAAASQANTGCRRGRSDLSTAFLAGTGPYEPLRRSPA